MVLAVPLDRLLGVLFRKFNVLFNWSTGVYASVVGRVLRLSAVVLVIYGGLLYLTWWSFDKAPSGFIPPQDKGYLLVNVQLPDAASVQRTMRVMSRIEDIARDTKGVKHTVSVAGTVDPLGRQLAQFRRFVYHAGRFSSSARRRAAPPRRSPTTSRSAAGPKSTMPWWASTGPRRWTAWAPRADSRSSSRTALRSARPRCNRPPNRSSPPAARSPACCKGCSAVSARTRPGFSSTSTANRPRCLGFRSATSSPRCRFFSARSTSTTSTGPAAPGRSTCRAIRASGGRFPTSSS